MLFAGQYKAKLERRGRVLFPQHFLHAISKQHFKGVYVFPSLDGRYLEGCGEAWLAYWSRKMDEKDSLPGQLSQQEILISKVMDMMQSLEIDKSGRITLPEELLQYVPLTSPLMFVGRGFRFQIRNRDSFMKHRRHMRAQFNVVSLLDQNKEDEMMAEETRPEEIQPEEIKDSDDDRLESASEGLDQHESLAEVEPKKNSNISEVKEEQYDQTIIKLSQNILPPLFVPYEHRPHFPVLLREVVKLSAPKEGEHIVDGTFGAGGYSHALLNKADIEVMGFDRDPNVFIDKSFFGEKAAKVRLMPFPFSEMKHHGTQAGWDKVDVIILDLGLSSMQLNEAERGFSFMKDGPLDMRMSGKGLTAADIVNTWAEKDIANILWEYGEERKSRQIAHKIILARDQKAITTTFELKKIIHGCFSTKARAISRTDVATRSFQGLRIAVNEELEELKKALEQAVEWLNVGGRLLVVSFHSLEDRIVKQFMLDKVGKVQKINKYLNQLPEVTPYSSLTRKMITPGEDELVFNPRSRSAKLRGLIKNKAEK